MNSAKYMLDTLYAAGYNNRKLGTLIGVSGMYIGYLRSEKYKPSEEVYNNIQTIYDGYIKEKDEKERERLAAEKQAQEKRESLDTILHTTTKKQRPPKHTINTVPSVNSHQVQILHNIETMRDNFKNENEIQYKPQLPTCYACNRQRVTRTISIDTRYGIQVCKSCLERDVNNGTLLQDVNDRDAYIVNPYPSFNAG